MESELENTVNKQDITNTPVPNSGGLPFQAKSLTLRLLSPEEQAKLGNDTKLVSDFKQLKLEKEAQKNWDIFYKRNTTKFFKDRHWTTREFAELCGKDVGGGDRLTVLEVGCGVGNFVFPLLQENSSIFFYACDFSPRAVQFVKDHPLYSCGRCQAFQNDLTKDALTANVPAHSVDIVTMIFVLSTVHPDKMLQALINIHSVLKPGGSVLIRDYGLYDHAMLRFTPGHKLADNFYMRQDGTRAYYFSQEKLVEVFEAAGFQTTTSDYILRETVNRAEKLCVPRVFVQAKFTKTCGEKTDKPDCRTDFIDNTEMKECCDNVDNIDLLPPGGSVTDGALLPPGGSVTDRALLPPGGSVTDKALLPPGGSVTDRALLPPGGSVTDRALLPPGGSATDKALLPPGGSVTDKALLPPGGSVTDRALLPPGGSTETRVILSPSDCTNNMEDKPYDVNKCFISR